MKIWGIDKEIRKLIDEGLKRATEIIIENKEAVQNIAKALLEKETLVKEEIIQIVEQGSLLKREPDLQ